MSEAERLADTIDAEFVTGRISNYNGLKAAAELRRLAAEVEALRKALSEVRFWLSSDTMIGQALIEKVDAALAERPGEKG